MSKKRNVLALYYSQTGRTKDVLDLFLGPLRDAPHVEVDEIRIEPQQPFPYPWPLLRVLSIFPEVVLEKPIPLNPLPFDVHRKYDLVILGCQVWFLSCSLPISSLFHSPAGRVFAKTSVIPILTFRRAWAQGMQCVEGHIEKLGGKLIGKVAICAQDKSTFPLLRAMKNAQRPDGEKEYQFDEEELERVRRTGKQIAEVLNAHPADLSASPLDETAVVIPQKPPREEMQVEERLIEDYEPIQKQRYIRFARFIQKRSRSATALRYFYTVLLTPLFVPPIYRKIPFLIVSRWIRTKIWQ